VFSNRKASETMRKKTTPLPHPSSTKPTSQEKPAPAAVSGNPTPNGKPYSDEAVRVRAYQKWEAAGKPCGDGLSYWLEAEQEMLQAK
jgi:hypothetical protein